MPLPLDLAHRRYMQQAGWTAELRSHLSAEAGIASAQRVLEVGCGTGAVLGTIVRAPRTHLHGLDIDRSALEIARGEAKGAFLSGGDAHHLPFRKASFDIVFFHFVLLWLEHPEIAVYEARRVSKPGGAVIAFAEPDYGGRVDFPTEFTQLGVWQCEALKAQGADPETGRRLLEIFHDAGLRNVQTGVLGAELTDDQKNDDLEWEVTEHDLAGRVDAAELAKYRELDGYVRDVGERVLYVPTFYAWAKSLP